MMLRDAACCVLHALYDACCQMHDAYCEMHMHAACYMLLYDPHTCCTLQASELLELGRARRSTGQKKGEWTQESNQRLVARCDR